MNRLIPLALGLTISATAALANPPLRDVAHVREGLITAGMAIELGDNCADVSVRMLRGLNYLNGLKSHARGLGYTDDQIEAYVDDRAEKARLEGIARARLAELGAVTGQGETYCTVARDQISQGTAVGRLLR
ncbi:DUF5333 domain-containing protein [Octadecabacter sp. R77987]|uniref:DUF5333 domain-containing protein n=1 Tax=Octadecabacter sp. R77987 TaxID=3093874 RepID=UPI00366FB4DB